MQIDVRIAYTVTCETDSLKATRLTQTYYDRSQRTVRPAQEQILGQTRKDNGKDLMML